MAIINKDKDPFIGLVLTEYGRKQLALGQLEFKYYAFGDSDIDYRTADIHSVTLKPYLNFKDLKSPLYRNNGTIFYDLTEDNIKVESLTTNIEHGNDVYGHYKDKIYSLDEKFMKFPGVVKNFTNDYIVEVEFDNEITDNDIVPFDYITFNIYGQPGTILKDKPSYFNRVQIDTIEKISKTILRLTLKQPTSKNVLNCKTYITKFQLMFGDNSTWNQVYLGGPNLKQTETRFDGVIQFFEEEHGLLIYNNQKIKTSDFTEIGEKDAEIELFDVYWSKSPTTKMGLKLKSSGEPKKYKSKQNTNFETTYYDLVDEYKNLVGKYFSDLKCFIINDPELSTTLADKNHRSWTLPEFNYEYVPSNGNGIFNKTNDDLYLTYKISGNFNENTNYCQYIKCVKNKKSDVQIELDFTNFNLKLMNNNNWLADNVSVLFQFVKPGDKIKIDGWYELPMLKSEKLTENSIKGKYNMNITHLLKGSKYNTLRVFNMDEQPFLGNVKIKTKTNNYKTTFLFNSENNTKLSTVNPTYTTNKPIRVSEVAIYDSKHNAVGLVKLSHSIKWRPDVAFTIKSNIIF